jgi:DNA-3-methyladenine glycosylase I
LDEQGRCWWCAGHDDYIDYHDREWGFPVIDDQRLFEKLSLEGFQSGLSWLTILRKRENFRAAFDGFDFRKIARYGERHVTRLLADAGIVRHRGKIEATIGNAAKALETVEEFGSLAAYVWRFEPPDKSRPKTLTEAQARALTPAPEAAALSKDLRRRGWRFVGPTTVYAFMQAMGMVNDHVGTCPTWRRVEQSRAELVRPG